jgi:hypothetical protein
MKKIVLFLLLLSFFSKGLTQVSLQTGAAEYRIPLYSLNDTKSGLGASVSIVYTNGGGLKVDQNASSVGTGWELNAGGYIARTVVGLPDDQKYWGSNFPYPDVPYDHFGYSGYYPNGYMYTDVSPADPVPGFAAQLLNYPSGVLSFKAPAKTAADRELDIFTFSINGKSGQFFIGKDKSIIQVVQSKMKVSFEEENLTSQGIRTTIKKFIVKDESGFIYTFSAWEVNTLIKYTVSSQIGFNTNTGTQYSYGNEFPNNIEANTKIISKWFLTSVVNPFTAEQITYSYDPFSVDILEGEKHLTNQKVGDKSSQLLQTDRYKYTSQRLNTILLPDNRKIKFLYYDNIQREDVPGDAALKQVEYYINTNGTDQLKNYFYLDQGYFVKSQIKPLNYVFSLAEKRFARLCLKSIKQFNDKNIGIPPFNFEYLLGDENIGLGVPARYTFLRDWWGYYSYRGDYGPNFMENTDGSVNLSYAFWGISNPITRDAASLGCLRKVYHNGRVEEFQYEQNTAAESGLEQQMAPGIRVKKYILSDALGNEKATEYLYRKTDGSTSGLGYENPIVTTQSILRVYKNTNGLVPTNFIGGIAAINKFKMAVSSVGGLLAANTFSLNMLTMYNQWQSIVFLVQILQYLFSPDYTDLDMIVNNFDNNVLNNPLPLLYSRVEVVETANNIAGGKIIYELNSYSDISALHPTYTFPFSAKIRYKPWVYGSPRKIQYYNSSNTLLREITNNYSDISVPINSLNFLSKRWSPNTIPSVLYTNNQYNIPASYITSEDYYPITGRMELIGTTEKEYDKNGNVSIKYTGYTYNPNNFQLKQTETYINSNEVYGKTIYYNSDFNASVNFTQQLTDKNIFNLPVLTADWKRVNGTQYLLAAKAVKLTVVNDGRIKIAEEYTREQASPIIGSFLSSFNPSIAPYHNAGFVSEKANTYSGGSMIESSDKGGATAFIMSRNGRELIAKIDNANYHSVAYSGFEGLDNGNWNFNYTAITSGLAKTGKQAYLLSGNNITTIQTLSTTQTYVITAWVKNGSISVNGLSPQLLQSDADGWTLYKTTVTGINNVIVSGNAIIDELRLCPQGALMTSYVYEPNVGVTAICDANNRITYTEYDDFGRVALTRDHQKNILKYFCYQFGNTTDPTPCYGQFVNNNILTGLFYKNNCSNGSGTPYEYTVPAGKHFSYISQQDANAKALNDYQTNGQSMANTNGNCKVYARINVENAVYSNGVVWADIVVRFYSDAAGTIPASISNSTISYSSTSTCDGNYTFSTTGSGTSIVLSAGAMIYYYYPEMGMPQCFINFYLNAGDNYTIIQ